MYLIFNHDNKLATPDTILTAIPQQGRSSNITTLRIEVF